MSAEEIEVGWSCQSHALGVLGNIKELQYLLAAEDNLFFDLQASIGRKGLYAIPEEP